MYYNVVGVYKQHLLQFSFSPDTPLENVKNNYMFTLESFEYRV